MLRGTLVGTLFGAMPGTGPTITTFIAYALERKISKEPERFGKGALEGVASPEAAAHSKTQVDFIPTHVAGHPGDAVMALILGALIIKGIQPGPQLITEHPDIFWGLIASFWIGNVLLVILNVPLIGVWVRLLQVPYRFLFPSALFFIASASTARKTASSRWARCGVRRPRRDPPRPRLSAFADPAGLRAGADAGGELPARAVDLARKSRSVC